MTSIYKKLEGTGASGGIAKGKALVLDDMINDRDLTPGYILITRHATPDLLPLVTEAAGVVCCTGGRLCHMAILCRELCVPCVTGVQSALDDISNDTIVEVDGLKGTVSICHMN